MTAPPLLNKLEYSLAAEILLRGGSGLRGPIPAESSRLASVACMTMSPGVLLSCGNSLLLRAYTLLGLPHGAAASYRLGSACTRLGALASTADAPRTNTLTHARLYTQTLPCPCRPGTRRPQPFLRLRGHTHTRTHTAPRPHPATSSRRTP
jgi:hypothetical protein